MRKSKKTTAAELMAQLSANPDYLARRKAQDEKFQRKADEYALAEAPVVKALNLAGVPVSSVWDLVNLGRRKPARTFKISTDPQQVVYDWFDAHGKSYTVIIPVLIEHLTKPYPDRVRAGIARALAIPEARFSWSLLVKLYKEEQGDWSRDGLAVALAAIADDKVLAELISLVKDPSNGISRVLLLEALGRSHLAQARKALMLFGTDPLLRKEAQRILNRSKRIRD